MEQAGLPIFHEVKNVSSMRPPTPAFYHMPEGFARRK